jgi:hypothetical protein
MSGFASLNPTSKKILPKKWGEGQETRVSALRSPTKENKEPTRKILNTLLFMKRVCFRT